MSEKTSKCFVFSHILCTFANSFSFQYVIEPAQLCRLRSKNGARTGRFRNEMEKESGKAERR